MDILTKAAGSDIHADVWWVYDKTTKQDQYKFEKRLLFRADSELQEAKEDGKVKQNLFRQGFFSKSPRELDSVQLEKNKRTFVNRVNALEKELSPKELEVGRKIDLRTIQEEPYRELYNLLFEGDEKVLVRLKSGIGEREDKSIIFSKNLKKVMEDLAKYGVNVSVKNRIGEMREQLASTSKVMQRYLLEGKGNLKADIAHLFHAKGAEYDDETESWTELVEYSGKPSIKILEDIYQNASIPIIRIGEKEKGIKGLQTYYSLDVDEFVDEIHSLISSASEDPAEHFKLFYNADNVVRMIYRLIPDILHHNQEKMAENEKKEILTKHFDVLEYLIRINDLTGNYGKLKESRLKSLKNVAKRREGGKLLSMNRNFPHLETAWEIYREDPDKYKPESEPRRTKTPSPKKFDAPAVRGTIPKKELRDLSQKVYRFGKKVKEEIEAKHKLWANTNPKNENERAVQERKFLLPFKRTLAKLTEEVESVGLLFEDTPESAAEFHEYGDLSASNIDDKIREAREGLQRAIDNQADENTLEQHKDYVKTLETLKELPKIREQVKTIRYLLDSSDMKEESLVDPPSEDTTEGSA